MKCQEAKLFSSIGDLTSLPSRTGKAAATRPHHWLASRNTRRETMKTMLLAATAALTLSAGAAYADGGDGPAANTFFTELPGVVAQAPVQNAPAVATAQNGQAVHAYVANSNRGTWLFPPNQNGGGND